MSPKNSTNTSFVDIDNARLEEQKQVMQQIVDEGHCPFCLENFQKYHRQPTLKNGKYWLVTLNQWPYEHTKHHFLAIYKQHAERLADLDPAAGEELIRFFQEIEKEYDIPGGGWAMRFGNTKYSAGTVKHLHVQFLSPDLDDPTYQPIRFKIGKDPEKK